MEWTTAVRLTLTQALSKASHSELAAWYTNQGPSDYTVLEKHIISGSDGKISKPQDENNHLSCAFPDLLVQQHHLQRHPRT